MSRSVPYSGFRMMFPPRPERATPPSDLQFYEEVGYLLQPKMDGDCCLVYTDGTRVEVTDRHMKRFSKRVPLEESGSLSKLHRSAPGKWQVLVGELMAKSKKDSSGRPWSDRLVIHDVLVFDGMHLVGSTFSERISLLDTMFGSEPSEERWLLSTGIDGVYRVTTHSEGFCDLFDKIVGTAEMYEGVVMKSATGQLEFGTSPTNTSKSQVKCRRSTKNYLY